MSDSILKMIYLFFRKKKKYFLTFILINLLVRTLQYLICLFVFAHKKLKKTTSKVAQKYFKKSPWATKSVQTEEFMFQYVAYRPTLCKNWWWPRSHILWMRTMFSFYSIRHVFQEKSEGKEIQYFFIFLYLLLTPAKKRACSLIIFKKIYTLLANFHVINWKFNPIRK